MTIERSLTTVAEPGGASWKINWNCRVCDKVFLLRTKPTFVYCFSHGFLFKQTAVAKTEGKIGLACDAKMAKLDLLQTAQKNTIGE